PDRVAGESGAGRYRRRGAGIHCRSRFRRRVRAPLAGHAMTTFLERVRTAGIEVVHLQFTDVAGSIKSLTIPASRMERTLEAGAWFDGASLEGLDRTVESQ